MKAKRKLAAIASVVLAIAMIGPLGGKAEGQQSRPRYNSPQYGERSWTLPADTVISVQMNTTLSSRTSHVGDKFIATVTVPVYVNGQTVIPAGSVIEGRVTQVTPARRMSRSGMIAIDFDDLVFPNGTRVDLVGGLTSTDPQTRRRIDDEGRVSAEGNKRVPVFIGGGGAIGAVLGGIAGGGRGAVLGGITGAAAGGAAILLAKGEEAQVPSGTPFGVQLKQSLIVRESFVLESAPTADRPADQPTTDRPDRAEPVGPPPDAPDRPNIDRPQPVDRAQPEDRSDGDRSAASEPAPPLSSPEMVRRAQTALRDQGYYEGDADGQMNSRTSSALRAYQREHRLQETGDLDPQTAKSLGITGSSSSSVSARASDRPREPRRDSAQPSEAVMATVLSARANKTADGAIYVLIDTQAGSGGWRWFGEQAVNGDTLEVYAKAVRPTGMVTQVLTRGRIELTARDGVEYVRRVVIHSASGDQVIALGGRPDAAGDSSGGSSMAASSAISLQRKAEDLLAEYQRVYGVRMTGNGVELDNASQYREPEIELLFAIDSFANAAQLYARLSASLRDRQSMHGATLALARQARRTDRVISTTTSRGADSLAPKWDLLRQDVLRLMQAYNINTSEIEN
jgi:peptidoglycan hydrolase-like protein with peptidoglycan-binding domain